VSGVAWIPMKLSVLVRLVLTEHCPRFLECSSALIVRLPILLDIRMTTTPPDFTY
jgi:hypothetical protein